MQTLKLSQEKNQVFVNMKIYNERRTNETSKA